MFTIKLYGASGCRQRILEAESFTILRPPVEDNGDVEAEITLHQKSGNIRYDIARVLPGVGYEGPERFERAIVENAAGKTTEMISLPMWRGVTANAVA